MSESLEGLLLLSAGMPNVRFCVANRVLDDFRYEPTLRSNVAEALAGAFPFEIAEKWTARAVVFYGSLDFATHSGGLRRVARLSPGEFDTNTKANGVKWDAQAECKAS
jgi:hypothetical protein